MKKTFLLMLIAIALVAVLITGCTNTTTSSTDLMKDSNSMDANKNAPSENPENIEQEFSNQMVDDEDSVEIGEMI